VKRVVVWHAVIAIAIGLANCPYLVSQASHATQSSDTPAYMNPGLPVDERVRDLVSRMTLEEKVGQLEAPLGWEMYQKAGDGVEVSEQFKKMVAGPEPGTLYGVLRADPWTKVTLATGL